MDEAGDADLLQRVVAGDVAAFERLYDRHSRAAFGLALRIVGEPGLAEDVVQDAFLTLWRQPASYGADRGAVRSWLLAIVHHRAVDVVRRKRREADGPTGEDGIEHIADDADTMTQAERNLAGGEVQAALRDLPHDQRRSIVLAYFGGHTHDEIARMLDVPLGTVKGRMRLGLHKMRATLRARGMEGSR